MTSIVASRWLILTLLALLLPGCYHMRVTPEAIAPRVITVRQAPAEALRRIRKVLEEDRQMRILEEEGGGAVLITAPRHFATDTGFGQPAGGRKYYTQMRIEVTAAASGQTTFAITPFHYEIRTTYAYGLDGQVKTMNKHYPYEQYPGMFDIAPLKAELEELAVVIVRACDE